ncbi:MAG: diaminopimelate decarboxylase, partial [Flavobacteriales bacterium]|nr:diaminopimelate decarboxylase [Flavobacteriales bacterium]
GLHQLNEMLAMVAVSNNVKLDGIHFHIGSQITTMYVFRELCAKINSINAWFSERGIVLNHINVGGGLGIDYEYPELNPIPNFKEFFQLFDKFLDLREGQDLHFELGRSVVGQCGYLLTKVLYVKDGLQTKFVICDAGMTELLRPALYQARHKIENISSVFTKNDNYDVVGPICESSDCFGKGIELPITQRGDIISIHSAGAYGEVMSSGYNLRTKAKAIYSTGLLVNVELLD